MKIAFVNYLLAASICLYSCNQSNKLSFDIGDSFICPPSEAKNYIDSSSIDQCFFQYNNLNYVLDFETSQNNVEKVISGIFYCKIKTFQDDNIYITLNSFEIISIYSLIENIGMPTRIEDDNLGVNPLLVFTSEEGNEYQYIYEAKYLVRYNF